jgi:hypothetical protein
MKRVKQADINYLTHMMGRFPKEYPSLIEYIAVVQEIDEYIKGKGLRAILGTSISKYERSSNLYPRDVRNAGRLLWNPENEHQDIVKSYHKMFGRKSSYYGSHMNFNPSDSPISNWSKFRDFMMRAAGSMIVPEVIDDE